MRLAIREEEKRGRKKGDAECRSRAGQNPFFLSIFMLRWHASRSECAPRSSGSVSEDGKGGNERDENSGARRAKSFPTLSLGSCPIVSDFPFRSRAAERALEFPICVDRTAQEMTHRVCRWERGVVVVVIAGRGRARGDRRRRRRCRRQRRRGVGRRRRRLLQLVLGASRAPLRGLCGADMARSASSRAAGQQGGAGPGLRGENVSELHSLVFFFLVVELSTAPRKRRAHRSLQSNHFSSLFGPTLFATTRSPRSFSGPAFFPSPEELLLGLMSQVRRRENGEIERERSKEVEKTEKH